MYRQGDVLLIPATIPQAARPVGADSSRLVLAEGEATGHAHTVLASEAELYETANSAERWLRVHVRATLTHQEHGAIALPAGDYRVVRQREYSPEAIRQVAD